MAARKVRGNSGRALHEWELSATGLGWAGVVVRFGIGDAHRDLGRCVGPMTRADSDPSFFDLLATDGGIDQRGGGCVAWRTGRSRCWQSYDDEMAMNGIKQSEQ